MVTTFSRRRRLAGQILLLSIAVALLDGWAIAWTGGGTGVAAVWLSNALVVAVLIRRPAGDDPAVLVSVTLANLMANLATRGPVAGIVPATLANLVEILIVVRWVRPPFARVGRFDQRTVIVRFLVAAPLGAMTGAVLGGLGLGIGSLLADGADLAAAGLASHMALVRHWFLADLIGLLIVTPALASLRPASPERVDARLGREMVYLLSAALAGAGLFGWGDMMALFTVPPIVALAAFRARLTTATLVIGVIAAFGLAADPLGGPLFAAVGDQSTRLLLFQGFIASLVFILLPVRALVGERDVAIDTVAATERKFERIAEASPFGILHLTATGQVTFVNRRWLDLTGYDAATVRRGRWLDPIAPEQRDEAHRLWARCRALGAPGHGEFAQLRPDGRRGWIDLSITPEPAWGNHDDGFVVRLSDVSERRRMEQALAASEALYRMVTEQAQDVIVQATGDGIIRYASSSAMRTLGQDPRRLVATPLAALVHVADRRALTALLSPAGAGPVPATFRMRHADGRWRWIEGSVRAIPADPASASETSADQYVVQLRDVDLRYRAQLAAAREAQAREELLRLLQLSESLAGMGHWRLDLGSRMLVVGETLPALLGLPALAGPGEPEDDARRAAMRINQLAPTARWALLRAIVRARRSEGPQRMSLALPSPVGTPDRHLELLVQRDPGADGQASGVVGVVLDVSAAEQARAELVVARDAANAAAQARSLFLATMSHEIRTPMTGVLGMIDLLRAGPTEAERDQYLATLKLSADLLMTVIDDVLDFSKIEAGNLALDVRDADLGQLLRTMLDLFGNGASQKGLLLDMALPAAEAMLVRCDPQRLQQVVANLLSNAIKFTEAGSVRLTVSTRRVDPQRRCWRVAVVDTGPGLSRDEQDRLFQPFVQADTSTSRRYGGTGLGLAISRRLVEAMGGAMGVASAPGEGACFWFEVTLEDGVRSALPPAEPSGDDLVATRGLSVLVAEDNPVNQLLLRAILRQLGHDMVAASDGEQAVAAAAQRRFDCILMDMQMPVLDGLAATRAIRAAPGPNRDTPILALTADASAERRPIYAGAGFDDFLAKPIDQRRLAQRLAQIAARQIGVDVDALAADRPLDDPQDGGRPDPVDGIGDDARDRPRDSQPAPIPDASGPPATTGLLDAMRLDELVRAISLTETRELMATFARECVQCGGQILAHARAGERDLGRRAAHGLKGAAGSLGATALAASASAIETAFEQGDPMPLATSLPALSDATAAAVHAWLATTAERPAAAGSPVTRTSARGRAG